MKALKILALAGAVCLVLAACGGGTDPFETQTAQALVQAPGVFTEELAPMEEEMICLYFGLDPDQVTEMAAYGSTGATAEEVGVFRFADAQAAKDNLPRLEAHLEYLKESNETYRPQEMPKLDKAVVERRGDSLLLLVCGDVQAARDILD